MSFIATAAIVGAVGAGISAAGGVAKAIDGGIKAKKAKEAAEKAQVELDKQKQNFANLDTSNPYLNMENTAEDLTVNTQQAEFAKQQSMQSQANIMDTMRGAAGGSGIAALAQTLANQGSLDAQKASVSIGQQEQANQQAERAQAGKIQGMERQGELISRQAEHGKVSSLMGMAADDVSNAKAERARAQEQLYSGIGDVGQAGMDLAGSLTKMGGVGQVGDVGVDGVTSAGVQNPVTGEMSSLAPGKMFDAAGNVVDDPNYVP